MIDLNQHSLELEYPCKWTYKVVGKESMEIKKAVKEVLNSIDYELLASKESKKGKFKSFSLHVTVNDEAQRKDLYHALSDHDAIKMVL